MKNFIKKSFVFLILFIVSNALYLLIIQQVDWNFKKRIESLNFESPKNDIVVIGNSLAMDGIDTGLLTEQGFTSYNLSIAGASLKTNYIQLKEYLSMYNHKPKYVILGLGAYMNSFTGEEIHPVVDFTRKEKQFNLSDIPMIKFKWIFKELIKKMVSKVHRDAYVNYGQLKFAKQIPDRTTLDTERTFPINKYKSSEILQSIINTCNENKIRLIVIEMPGYKKVRHKKEFNCLTLDKANNNGWLFDYNNVEDCEIYDSEEDWVGNHHLNVLGAKKCTEVLLDDLRALENKTSNHPNCI